MADAEYEPGSAAAAEALAGLQGKLQNDLETQERAHDLVQNLQEIQARMGAAKAGAGTHRRGSNEESIFSSSNNGVELTKKSSILPPTISWHFIGTLQSSAISKLARIQNLFAVHSIDGAKKAVTLNRLRPDDFPPVNVFVQVNTSGEDSKSGLEPSGEELWETIQTIRKDCPKLTLKGLMTIGAIARSQAAKEGEENEDFITLVNVAEGLEKRIEQEDGEKVTLSLSMGMSDDFENAISMGASCVRVGSSIFGTRPKKADAKVL
ncbi:hypothetical protein H072_1661 [Dactylellina haptotyla CBS 200.50]|uniref:Pyridoxal phosphate homeostasis protein n=1 Tax=Dactylellina haptotyla (strain CBS 200.50) TaxID=1284197 RepID=S8C9Q1_DACHA|nr:hypothetical protein H072_1661 [Dactylellina haptotyla CBS 200.50]